MALVALAHGAVVVTKVANTAVARVVALGEVKVREALGVATVGGTRGKLHQTPKSLPRLAHLSLAHLPRQQ